MANLTSVTLTAGVPTAGTGTVGTIDNVTGTAGAPSVPVLTVQGVASGTPQPVSGTVAVSGTVPVSIATNTPTIAAGTNTIGSVKVTDGTNVPAVKAASTAPIATDPALVVAISPNSVNANGQAVMASSAPVVIASNQSSIPVTLTSTTLTGNSAVNLAQVAGATTAVGSGVQATALRTTLATDSPGLVTLGQTTKSASVPVTVASDQGLTVTSTGPYPSGATPITASSTGTTAATVATLSGAVGKTTYISGFAITADATAALSGAATVAGTVSGSLNYIQSIGSATAAQLLTQNYNPPIPASATNTAITVTSAAAGTGGSTAVTAWGYQL